MPDVTFVVLRVNVADEPSLTEELLAETSYVGANAFLDVSRTLTLAAEPAVIDLFESV